MAASTSSSFSPSGFLGFVRSSSQRPCVNSYSLSVNRASSEPNRRRGVVAAAAVNVAAEHDAVYVDPYFRPPIPAAFCHVTRKTDDVRSEEKRSVDEDVDAPDERLIKDSIGEIVRNLGQNPSLVHLFSIRKSQSPPIRVRRESAATTAERWSAIKEGFEREGCKPDAIVLLQHLGGGKSEESSDATSVSVLDLNKTWGMLVQWRGLKYASCYILNTTRVSSSGAACTHFCLARANCSSGESLEAQLRKAWLQGR